MTDVPPALRRALELLAEPPADPEVSKGYLDLLGGASSEGDGVAKNTGPIQAAWALRGARAAAATTTRVPACWWR